MKFRIAWWTTSWLVASIPSFLGRRTARVANAFLVTPNNRNTDTTKKVWYHGSSWVLHAKPKQGKVVDSYQTVSIYCSKCNLCLFRYKKKNGTKSNLVKCYIERITEDSAGILLAQQQSSSGILGMDESYLWQCPNCQTQFARSSMIHGLPALKMIGGKVRMAKK